MSQRSSVAAVAVDQDVPPKALHVLAVVLETRLASGMPLSVPGHRPRLRTSAGAIESTLLAWKYVLQGASLSGGGRIIARVLHLVLKRHILCGDLRRRLEALKAPLMQCPQNSKVVGYVQGAEAKTRARSQ